MRRRNVAIIAIVFVGVVSVRIATNPLRQSDTEIRMWLLEKTPPGSTSNEVWSTADRQGWKLHSPTNTSIAGKLGGYQGFPFYTFVYASWEFDASNRLEDIRIGRISDAW